MSVRLATTAAAMMGFAVASLGLAGSARAAETGMTEGAARMALINGGCSNLGSLSKDSTGAWHATCQGTPFPTAMSVGADGKISKGSVHQGMSEGNARSALSNAGCGNISGMRVDTEGVWHAACQGTPFPSNMMVGPDGKAKKG